MATALGVGVLGLVWFGLVETLPTADRKPFQPLKWMREYFQCLTVLQQDFTIMKLWFIVFFIWTCIGAYASIEYNFLVGSLGFRCSRHASLSLIYPEGGRRA